MMKNLLLLTLVAFQCMLCASQETNNPKLKFRYNNYFEVMGMAGDMNFGGHASWSHYHRIGKNKKHFKFGYGLRITSYFGFDRNYITAPAKLTTGFTGPLVAFADNIEENLDTIFLSRPQTNSLNIFIVIQYSFLNRWDLGFNLDIAGVSFGTRKISQYHSSQNPPGIYAQAQDVFPTGFNIFLSSDNSSGGLTSEAFIRFWISNQWSVKASFIYAYSEYTTVNNLRLDNDRFRNKMILGAVGITFCPWRSEIFRRKD